MNGFIRPLEPRDEQSRPMAIVVIARNILTRICILSVLKRSFPTSKSSKWGQPPNWRRKGKGCALDRAFAPPRRFFPYESHHPTRIRQPRSSGPVRTCPALRGAHIIGRQANKWNKSQHTNYGSKRAALRKALKSGIFEVYEVLRPNASCALDDGGGAAGKDVQRGCSSTSSA